MVSGYLKKGLVHVDCVDKFGFSALMRAVQNNRLEVIKLLINQSCAIDLPNKDGWTSLLWAAFKGYDDIVGKILLELTIIYKLFY